MKKKLFIIAVIFVAAFIFIKMIYEDMKYNSFICQTKKLELKEVILYVSGRANDTRIETTKHKKPFSLYISKVITNNGFPEDYIDIKEGDSIIKKAGSKELTIKRGKKIAVYLLNCND